MNQDPTPVPPLRPYLAPRLEHLGSIGEATQTTPGGQGGPDGPNYPAEALS